MNKIIEEANALGISLVGWTDFGNGKASRATANGGEAMLYFAGDCWGFVGAFGEEGEEFYDPQLTECLARANAFGFMNGGWAPAPIGMGLSEWNYDVDSAPQRTLIEVSYLGDDSIHSFNDRCTRIGDTWSASSGHGKWDYISGVYAWRYPRSDEPAPPEVKE